MIISASRRTDIPAYYSDWFFNRLEAGYCLLQNPFNANLVRRIDLTPKDVDVFVFWTKNPASMMNRLYEIDNLYDYVFLFTLNDYPKWLEPNLPSIERRIQTFKELSRKLGSKRVIWRYDPIILSNSFTPEYHLEVFKLLCKILDGYTKRVIISFVDLYDFVKKRLEKCAPTGEKIYNPLEEIPIVKALSRRLAEIAANHGMDIFSCAELIDLTSSEVIPGACIDGMYLYSVFAKQFPIKKDPGQRKECLCAISTDIGTYDTCRHLCPYCYATKSIKRAEENCLNHDPMAPSLSGWIKEPENTQINLL